MPNVDAPSGFRPVRRISGSPLGAMYKAYIPSSDGTAVFIGDLVKFDGSSGAAGLTIAGEDMEGVPSVVRAAITDFDVLGTDNVNAIAGVVVGFKSDPDNLMLKHRAASTNRIAYICPIDQDIVFEIQEDADTTPIAAASIGLNAQVLQTQAGSPTTGLSGMELDSSTVATTNTFPVRIIGLSKRVGNAFNTAGSGSDQAKFEVVFNFRGGLMPYATAVGGTAV